MKQSLVTLSLIASFLAPSSLLIAQSAPASGGISVISGGGLKPIAPQNKNNPSTPQNTDKPAQVKAPKKPKVKESPKEEVKSLNLELKTLIHTKISSVGDTVILSMSQSKGSLLPKGALVIGKITQIDKVSKKAPGVIKIELSQIQNATSSIPIQAVLEYSKSWGDEPYKNNKEFFLPLGHPLQANLEKAIKLNAPIKLVKLAPTKGVQLLHADMEPSKLKIKKLEYKTPNSLETFVEFPNTIKVDPQDRLKLKVIQINDLRLNNPIYSTDETSKISDRNKNKMSELNFKFNPAELIRYLAVGSNKIWFSTTTKTGKTLEVLAELELELL